MTAAPPARPATRSDLAQAAILVLVLAVLGALGGLLWAAWSPKGPAALVLSPGVYEPDETEAFVAGDGRFLVLAAALGLIAALAVWFGRPSRGVAAALGLSVGGLAGSLLMWLVGHLVGGGDGHGRSISGSADRYSSQLPLTVHAHGLLLIQAAVSMLVYGLLVAFAVHDDLGRPEAGPLPESVAAGAHPQDGWGYGDAAGPLQQGDFPPQQPRYPDQSF